MPSQLSFNSDKVLCVVRNPLDSIISFAQLANTMSHSASVDFKFHEDYAEWWTWWVKFLCDKQTAYFDTLLRHCTEDAKNPIYIVRYEDLCDNHT